MQMTQLYTTKLVIHLSVSTQLLSYLQCIATWFEHFCLTLSVNKTVSICFSPRPQSSINANGLNLNITVRHIQPVSLGGNMRGMLK